MPSPRMTAGTPIADAENRIIALAVAARETRCDATATVHADPVTAKGQAGVLVCTLPRGHSGRMHFDGADEIWWSRDAEDAEP